MKLIQHVLLKRYLTSSKVSIEEEDEDSGVPQEFLNASNFMREIKLQKRSCDQLVSPLASLVKKGEYFIVYDMPQNYKPLKSVLACKTKLEEKEWRLREIGALSIVRNVLEALKHMHEMKFVHGNLTLKSIYLNENFQSKVMAKAPHRY